MGSTNPVPSGPAATAVQQTPLIVWLFLVTNPNYLKQLEAATVNGGGILNVTFTDKSGATTNIRELADLLKADPGDVQILLQSAYLNLSALSKASFDHVSTQFQTYMGTGTYDPMECGVAGIKTLIP